MIDDPPPIIAYTYNPLGAARELFFCRAPEILIVGGAGTGKTRATLQKILMCCEQRPGCRILILRDYRIALNETVLVTWETKVLDKRIPAHASALAGPDRAHRQRYNFPNGSQVILGGLDAPERFMSGEYDWAYLAEGTDVKDEGKWEMVLSRLRNGKTAYAQGIVDCNPGPPSHWLNRRPDRKRANGEPVMVRLLSLHRDNPSLTPEYLDTLDNLTGVRRARLFEGKWAAAEGAVYDFERSRHVRHIPPEELALWPRVLCGCDDGTRNAFAFVRGCINADGHLHIAAEHHSAGMVETAKIDAARRLGVGTESIELDPAAAGLRLAMSNAGLPMHAAENDVLGGISKVGQRFKDNTISIAPACVELIRELEGYEWLDNEKKDQPVKEADHACFVAGTFIVTARGEVPIEHVRVGDQVRTRGGWRPVLAAECTGRRDTVKLWTYDGRSIEASADHPVWVEGRGMCAIDSLRYGDKLVAWNESSTAAFPSDVTPTQSTAPAGAISAGGCRVDAQSPCFCIGTSGSAKSARSPRATTSTTRTATPPTIGSPTLRASLDASTCRGTAANGPQRTPSACASTSDAPLPPRRSGTHPKRDGNGTASTRPSRDSDTSANVAGVNSVTNRSGRRPTRPDSAISTARRNIDGPQASTTLIGSVGGAVGCSGSTGTCVTDSVLAVAPWRSDMPVFNLTVDGEHEYFAGGILVSNCDALRYLVHRLDRSGGASVHMGYDPRTSRAAKPAGAPDGATDAHVAAKAQHDHLAAMLANDRAWHGL